MCVCPQIGCRTITSAILDRFSPNFACRSEIWLFRGLLFLRQTGSILPILEMCKIRFWQFRNCGGHIFPRIITKTPNWDIVERWLCTRWSTKPEIEFGFREVQISVSVWISSGLERLRTQFFAVFHKTLLTAWKCGRLDTCCSVDKPEVDYRF